MDNEGASCKFFEWLILALILTDGIICSSALKTLSSTRSGQWKWDLLLNDTGVVAMHMAVTHQNNVLIFDQTEAGPSRYPLRRRYNGRRCKKTGHDLEDSTCFAHSLEYNVLKNKLRPLHLDTDTWCSSGSFLSNGTLIHTGGNGDGSRRVRYFRPCKDGHCDWMESKKRLLDDRWYATNLYLPREKSVIVVGGRETFTFEFVPKSPGFSKAYNLPFLRQTYERDSKGNNLYPFLHLSSDGRLFIFANRDSILFNYRQRKVVKKFPRMPGDGSRSYPSTGSSVILPLDYNDQYARVEVMICGGAARGAYAAAQGRKFMTALRSCGRMVITGKKHKWSMETMPGPRLMSDMLILPTGDILIINGAKRGCAGWNSAAVPALEPYLYRPNRAPGRRFQVLKRTKIARMYHSSAVLLPDGRVLVAGGNPNDRYTFRGVRYPTELRLQAFVPDYMSRRLDRARPKNVTVVYPGHGYGVENGDSFGVEFRLGVNLRNTSIVAYAPPFTTHSFSMNQRMLRLRCLSLMRDPHGMVQARVVAPASVFAAPPGYYMLTAVNDGIPSKSTWVRII